MPILGRKQTLDQRIARNMSGDQTLSFYDHKDQLRKITVGEMPRMAIEQLALNLEKLVACVRWGIGLEPELAAWTERLPKDQWGKLRQFGLLQGHPFIMLGEHIQRQCARFEKLGLAAETIRHRRFVGRMLVDHFGFKASVASIKPSQIADWRAMAMTENKWNHNTACKYISAAFALFQTLVQDGKIQVNPFTGLPRRMLHDPTTDRYVPADDVRKVIDACDDSDMRVMIALSRFAALRVPTEAERLTWEDVQLSAGKLVVRGKKDPRDSQIRIREVPLRPEVQTALEVHKLYRPPGPQTPLVITREPLDARRHMLALLKKVGMDPWPRLFHNMRASMETDWHNAGNPMHAVNQWVGHSGTVAVNNYLKVRDEDFEKGRQVSRSFV